MKEKLKNYALGLLMLLLMPISACKKEAVYPDDIPQWLKDKIEAYHEETRKYKGGCKEDLCIQIFEYNKSDTLLYFIDEASPFGAYNIFDYGGKEQCYYDTEYGWDTTLSCGPYGYPFEYKLNRVIWRESFN